MRRGPILPIFLFACHSLLVSSAGALELPAKGIQDNSFFIEEAYNQEPGIVQHIFNLPVLFTRSEKEISPSLTQEWPVLSQTHQLSYTVPYTFQEDQNGFEDVRLNYRLQALVENNRTPAFAPRLTLVLPAGDAGKGFGHDRLGYEINLPLSKIVSDRWTLHFNAGGSFFPEVKGRNLTNYNLGASAIYAISRDFNLMLESVAGWEEDIDPARRLSRSTTALISPGGRYAFNLPNEAQLVIGGALPIGLSFDSTDWGLFFYFSFEHRFARIPPNE